MCSESIACPGEVQVVVMLRHSRRRDVGELLHLARLPCGGGYVVVCSSECSHHCFILVQVAHVRRSQQRAVSAWILHARRKTCEVGFHARGIHERRQGSEVHEIVSKRAFLQSYVLVEDPTHNPFILQQEDSGLLTLKRTVEELKKVMVLLPLRSLADWGENACLQA